MKDRIKIIRKKENLSQEAFAKKIAVSRSAICKMESGENSPSDQTIELICRIFSVNENWLRSGNGEPYKKRTRNQELQEFSNEIKNNLNFYLDKMNENFTFSYHIYEILVPFSRNCLYFELLVNKSNFGKKIMNQIGNNRKEIVISNNYSIENENVENNSETIEELNHDYFIENEKEAESETEIEMENENKMKLNDKLELQNDIESNDKLELQNENKEDNNQVHAVIDD